MKTNKIITLSIATLIMIGSLEPTVTLAKETNQINEQILINENNLENSKFQIVDDSSKLGYYPEENSIVCFLKGRIQGLTKDGYLLPSRDFNITNQCKKVKINLDINYDEFVQEVSDYLGIRYINSAKILPIMRDIYGNKTKGVFKRTYLESGATLKETLNKARIDLFNLKTSDLDDQLFSIYFEAAAYEENIGRDANINYQIITDNGKILSEKEIPKLSQKNNNNLKVYPSDSLISKDLENLLDFKYLCEGSTIKPEDLISQEITVHLNYAEFNYRKNTVNPNSLNKDIVLKFPQDKEIENQKFIDFIKSKGAEIVIRKTNSTRVIISDILTNITFDVKYVVKEPSKILEIPNYFSKEDKELQNELDSYEKAYLEKIIDMIIEILFN